MFPSKLVLNMRGKITLVSSADFFTHFVPSVDTVDSALGRNAFARFAKPFSKSKMCRVLVSNPLTFAYKSRIAHAVVLAYDHEQRWNMLRIQSRRTSMPLRQR